MNRLPQIVACGFIAAALVNVGGCCLRCEKPGGGRGTSEDAATTPSRWVLDDDGGACEIRFSFPTPHDIYRGDVNAARGLVELDDRHLSGAFSVRATDVDMGDPDLTDNVRYAAEMLRGGDFPEISYLFSEVPLGEDLTAGGPVPVVLRGDFQLKGVTVPLQADATVKLIGEADSADLELAGTFELDQLQERFSVTGPGGDDDPAGNRLLFTFRFVLRPRAISP